MNDARPVGFAGWLGFSAMYQCDVEKDRRAPSVRYVNAVCEILKLHPETARSLRRQAARAHGWEI